MSAELKQDLQLQIAHLLLIDVVGYSKLLVNEQIELLYELNRVVRSSECFRAAEAKDKLIRLPTGDGMALLFFENPEQPVRCALEINERLKESPNILVRMGIHSGPVNQVPDVNDHINIAGAGINIAQRVLDCGDAGHILLSKHVADDLLQYRHWSPHLRDLGECEVKHGLRLHVYSLSKDGIGNPEVPEKLKPHRWKTGKSTVRPIPTITRRWVRLAALIVGLAALAMTMSILWQRRAAPRPSFNASASTSTKSIAVMPFENLSDDKQNAYFADGVQDEILTNLAKVADLKVISRTSVMQYKNVVQRNVREIAKLLGVSHILEGSVQRSGNRIRLTAQLIDARTDTHVWAERYDRDLADVFALENELSEQIVSQLKSRLSAKEKTAIEQKPTSNLGAYDLYTRAKLLIERSVFNESKSNLFDAVRLLEQAVKSDPSFVLAYYQLAHAHDQIYFRSFDRTKARLALADTAIQKVRELQPDSAEAHLALAKHLYWAYRDYDHARQEIDVAIRALPNEPTCYLLLGYIDRRQSHWDASIRNMERAIELDPQNPFYLQQASLTYEMLRRYGDAITLLDRALTLTPDDAPLRLRRGGVEFNWKGDFKSWHSASDAIDVLKNDDAAIVAKSRFELAIYERDYNRALEILRAGAAQAWWPVANNTELPPRCAEALLLRLRGNDATEKAALDAARAELETIARDQSLDSYTLAALGFARAVFGNKREAIAEGRQAVELAPITKDSVDGTDAVRTLALIYAWTGKGDKAIEKLEAVAKQPGYLSYGALVHSPVWDPLRKDPRFEKIVGSLAPKP
jgi:TolB-like protein/class 3 adenylate cyclase/Tfp pilus assembly protein PilF